MNHTLLLNSFNIKLFVVSCSLPVQSLFKLLDQFGGMFQMLLRLPSCLICRISEPLDTIFRLQRKFLTYYDEIETFSDRTFPLFMRLSRTFSTSHSTRLFTMRFKQIFLLIVNFSAFNLTTKKFYNYQHALWGNFIWVSCEPTSVDPMRPHRLI